MTNIDYSKQAQDYYNKAPLIILGSGASAAHGMSGMWALAKHLQENTDTSKLSTGEMNTWDDFCRELKTGTDLEAALHKVSLSESLTKRVIQATWDLINAEDCQIFRQSLQNKTMFPLSRLLRQMFQSSLRKIDVVTTNYDRLAEYACDQAMLHHYTGFSHGFFRQQAKADEITSSRRVNIWKVHGSVDWFQIASRETVAFSNIGEIPENYEPQIVTPGAQKYARTHQEPYRSIISSADQAITNAKSYLCVGYGFNDEHIQPKLMDRCQQHDIPITIISHKLTDSAKKLIVNSSTKNFLAIECGTHNNQSIVHSSLEKTPFNVEQNIWSLEGYLSLIT